MVNQSTNQLPALPILSSIIIPVTYDLGPRIGARPSLSFRDRASLLLGFCLPPLSHLPGGLVLVSFFFSNLSFDDAEAYSVVTWFSSMSPIKSHSLCTYPYVPAQDENHTTYVYIHTGLAPYSKKIRSTTSIPC